MQMGRIVAPAGAGGGRKAQHTTSLQIQPWAETDRRKRRGSWTCASDKNFQRHKLYLLGLKQQIKGFCSRHKFTNISFFRTLLFLTLPFYIGKSKLFTIFSFSLGMTSFFLPSLGFASSHFIYLCNILFQLSCPDDSLTTGVMTLLLLSS